MQLRWERKGLGRYTAYDDEGHQLAQIAHIVGPGGADAGWMVWLTLQQGELFDHYPQCGGSDGGCETSPDATVGTSSSVMTANPEGVGSGSVQPGLHVGINAGSNG